MARSLTAAVPSTSAWAQSDGGVRGLAPASCGNNCATPAYTPARRTVRVTDSRRCGARTGDGRRVGLFGIGGRKRRRAPDFQTKLDDLAVERARLSLDERIQRNQLLSAAAQRDPVAAASIAFNATGKGARAHPIQTREPLGDKVIEQLVGRVLSERDDDPAMKIARLRRAALEDRALRRVMEDDDDDGDGGGSMVRDVMVALVTALGAALAPQLASLAPAVAARMQTAPVGSSSTPGASGAAPRPRLGLGSPLPVAAGPVPGGAPMSNVSPLSRLKVRFVLRQLDQSTPEDFAVWALGQPAAAAMLEDLSDTPDDQLGALLDDAIADPASVEWVEVLQWLRDHPSESARIVAEIRRQLVDDDGQVGAAAPASSSEPPPVFATGGW